MTKLGKKKWFLCLKNRNLWVHIKAFCFLRALWPAGHGWLTARKYSEQFQDFFFCICTEVWIVVLWLVFRNWSDNKNPWRVCTAVCFYSCSPSSFGSSYIWFSEQFTTQLNVHSEVLLSRLVGNSSILLDVPFSSQILFILRQHHLF